MLKSSSVRHRGNTFPVRKWPLLELCSIVIHFENVKVVSSEGVYSFIRRYFRASYSLSHQYAPSGLMISLGLYVISSFSKLQSTSDLGNPCKQMTSPWTSRIRAGKIFLAVVVTMHVGTLYLKPVLSPGKDSTKSDNREHNQQTCDWWSTCPLVLLILMMFTN